MLIIEYSMTYVNEIVNNFITNVKQKRHNSYIPMQKLCLFKKTHDLIYNHDRFDDIIM